jgi:ACS family D-galactonate transporter-like MFS transporter
LEFCLGAGVLINYFDRINLSVAAPQLKHEFNLTDGELGWLFSGFFWSYALLQIPTGMILDRFGVTWVNRISTFFWSVTSAATAFATGLGTLLGAARAAGRRRSSGFSRELEGHRLLVPAPGTSACDSDLRCRGKVLERDRRAVGGAGRGEFRLALGVRHHGLLSFIYFLAFTDHLSRPSKHPRFTAEEREYIREGGATPEGPAESGEVAMLGYLLRNRKVWGLTIGFAAYGYSFYLFLTWLPNYLVETMHMSILKSAGYTAIPMDLRDDRRSCRRWLADRPHDQHAAIDETLVRKTVLVLGMLLGLAVFGATLYHQSRLGSRLDLGRVERPGGGRTGGLVDPLVDRAARRHRHHRRHHEFPEQSDGGRGTGDDGLRRWGNEILYRRIPDRRRRADRRHRSLPRPSGPRR